MRIILFLLVVSSSASAADSVSYLKNFPAHSYHKLNSGPRVVGRTESLWSQQGNNLIFTEDSAMKLMLFKKEQEIRTLLKVTTTTDLKIQNFDFSMTSMEAKIQVKGQRSGDKINLKVTQAGNTQSKDLQVQEPVLLSPLIRPFVLMKGLKNGASQSASLLEPSALTTIPLKIDLSSGADGIWSLNVNYLSQNLTSKMKESGELVYEKSDLAGMIVEATPVSAAEFQKLDLSQIEGTKEDLVDVARVQFPTIAKPRELKHLAVKISGVDLRTFELTRHRQKLENDILKITLESGEPSSSPIQSLVGQKQYDRYLQGDASIQVFESNIQKKAHEIVGKENDLWKRAQLVYRWVFENIQKLPTVSVPNALEVLKTLRGDCNEHAVLFTALARAAGVPTRMVVGLVYGERMASESGFFYHAWVEVFTGKEWRSLDPTWGQNPVDATHLAFVEGGLDQQVLVTSLMGRIHLSPANQALLPKSTPTR